jgi:hypothetical protein
MITAVHVDLGRHLNRSGASVDRNRAAAALNAWGNSFPAEELPLGGELVVAGVPFALVKKTEDSHDHLEALSQRLLLPRAVAATSVALLCCGEMGAQEITLDLCAQNDELERVEIRAGAWLVPAGGELPMEGYCCSHLHYVGGYELNLLRPVLWCVKQRLRRRLDLISVGIGCNPLFHLFALTLLDE